MTKKHKLLEGIFSICLGSFQLFYAWRALIGKPLSLGYAAPGLDIVVYFLRLSSKADAYDTLAVISAFLGLAFIAFGLHTIKKTKESKN